VRKNKLHLWLFISTTLLILTYLFFNLVFSSIPNNANQTWATLYATDDTIAELGDASHIVEITPDTILQIGETDTVFGLKVTLSNVGFISQEENTDPNHPREYWFVDFSVENISSGILYGIHPVVNTQLQYIIDGTYIWEMPDEYQCTPEIEFLSNGLQPNTSFQCRFIYSVPLDERSLFWVYTRTDIGADDSYEERYLVFRIR